MQRVTSSNPRLLARFKAWVHAHPARTIIVIILGLIIAINLTVLALFWRQPEPEVKAVKKAPVVIEEPAPVFYAPLTGIQIESELDKSKPVTAIMIENSPDARPQSGLKDAEVVYEAVAEGGITRFLAVYQQNKPSLIGPVRSLRMYFLDWATPYDASIAHVGGSYQSLQKVRNGQYRDIDQFFNAAAYWRSADRYAPHNVYTSFAKLDQLNSQKGYTSSNPTGLERIEEDQPAATQGSNTDEKASTVESAKKIDINISGPTYNSSYSYDEKTKQYARSQAGAPHTDREKGQITADVVIALRVTMTQVFEDGYRESIPTTGKGDAVIFQNGTAKKVSWRKDSQQGQLYFTDSEDKRILLQPGTTWISAVPISGGSVSWR